MITVWAALVNGALVSLGLTAALSVLLRFGPGRGWNARTRYVVWMAALLVSVAMPLFYAPIEFSYPMGEAVSVEGIPLDSDSTPGLPFKGDLDPLPVPLAEYNFQETIASSSRAPGEPIFPVRLVAGTWATWLLGVWLVGSVFMLSRLILGWVVLERRKAEAFALPPGRAARLVKWLRYSSGRASRIRLAISPNIASPIATGPYRPTVLIPSRMIDELDDFELDQLVLHEVAHLGRRDDYALVAERLLEAVFVFYPAVWWIKRHIEFEREVACDDFVVETTRRPREYARCLARAAELAVGAHSHPLAAFAARANSRLEKRVDMLLDKTRTSETRLLWVRASALVFALVAVSSALVHQPGLVAFVRPVQASLASATDAARTDLPGVGSLAATSASRSLPAETPPPVPERQEPPLSGARALPGESGSIRVRIPVTVTDSRNSFVQGLGREHFRLLVDGQEMAISEFLIPGDPTSIAIVNEVAQVTSRSGPESELPRQVAEQVLRGGDRVGRDIFLLASTEATGPASLRSQIEIAAAQMRSAGNSVRAIVIVSGRAAHWADYTEELIRNVAAATDLPIYAVSRGGDDPSGTGARGLESSRAVLDQITEQTGGLHLVIDHERDVSVVANRMRTGMRTLYVLGFELDDSDQDEKYRRIEVQVVAPNGLQALAVAHRVGYRMPGAGRVPDLPAEQSVEQATAAAGPLDRFDRPEAFGRVEPVEVVEETTPPPAPEPVFVPPPQSSREPQEPPKPTEAAIEVKGLGRITEINAGERWFELRSRIPEPVQVRTSVTSVWGGAVGVGGGIPSSGEPSVIRVPDDPRTGQPPPDPRVDPSTGRRDPRLDPRIPTPVPLPLPRGPTPGRIGYVTSRILVTDETLIQHNGRTLRFGQLNVGDTVSLTGVTRGDQVEATRIDRQFRGP